MSGSQTTSHPPPRLGLNNSLRVLWPYLKSKFMEQVKSVWFIIFYLCVFQILILKLPIVYSGMIATGIFIVALGLMFFMEGLRLGLMPFGESIGTMLPRKSKLPLILGFSFLLGIGATLAEPSIAVLQAAGAAISPEEAPLLYSLLNDFEGQLVGCVASGVGFAVAIGILRFFYGWSLKKIIIPSILFLSLLTVWAQADPTLAPVIALAWDCGAVTTGPVTVPLVLALGIGVCRIVSSGAESDNAGFGIVTLSSLFPIIMVLGLSIYHQNARDYYGQENYRPSSPAAEVPSEKDTTPSNKGVEFTDIDFRKYQQTGQLPSDSRLSFTSGTSRLESGIIIHEGAQILIEKTQEDHVIIPPEEGWDPGTSMLRELRDSLLLALQAVIPLCLFLFVTLRFILREKIRKADEILVGLAFTIVGMTLFGLGISLGLTPLGEQLGSNVPSAFASITPWSMEGTSGPLFSTTGGKWLAVIFAFFLGYGATLAEPALNALGTTVEKITVGAFKKSLLMQSVALGVALGIAGGILKIAYNIPLTYLLLPPYLALLVLTMASSEEFVNFGWDSAGVTTGPITVPLVLAMGLGIGSNVPGVLDGFGILALASVGPIITVLTVGLIVQRPQESPDELEEVTGE